MRHIRLLLVFIIVLTSAVSAGADQIDWFVISGGASDAAQGNAVLLGTVGQTAVGRSAVGNTVLHQGYWQDFTPQTEPCCGLYTGGYTGNTDCSTDGVRNLSDIIVLIDHVYLSMAPLCCEANGNVSGDPEGTLNLTDIVNLIDHVYISYAPTALCP